MAKRQFWIFLRVLSPLLLLSFGTVFYLHQAARRENVIFLANEAEANSKIATTFVQETFRSIKSDILFLSDQNDFNAMVEKPGPASLRAIEGDFIQFAKEKKTFSQVRYLDSTGMEVVRVNYNDGKPEALPKERLQDKSDRYYFVAGMKAARGEIYISPFDLSGDEKPPRPTIRFSLPIFDSQSNRRGVLILNYLGANILRAVSKGSRQQMSALILNDKSYYLLGLKREDEWGFMFPEKKDRNFQADFPDEWQSMKDTPSGEIISRNGIFIFNTIRDFFGSDADASVRSDIPAWKLVNYVPAAVVEEPDGRQQAVEYVLCIVLSVVAAHLFSRTKAKQLLAQEGERQSLALLKTANAELEDLSQRLSHYVSPQVYKSIFSRNISAEIVTRRKKLTVFFSDIINFTQITESMESEDLTKVMNEYFDAMSIIAIKHGATIDKFVGDAVMVFFGDPTTLGVQEDAVQCAAMGLEMISALEALRGRWRRNGVFQDVQIRAGIHTGYCAVGNFGSKEKMDYTIIGRNVNIAKRLQELARPDQIVISSDTRVLISGDFACLPNGTAKMKGFDFPIETYYLVGKQARAMTSP